MGSDQNGPAHAVTPGKPLVVRVGFSGHRDLGAVDPVSLSEELRSAMRAVLGAAKAFVSDSFDVVDVSPVIELVTGLAAGADQIAAAVCLEEGHRLTPVSPFSWREFERDFMGDLAAKAELRRILAMVAHQNAESKRGERGFELSEDFVRKGPMLEDLFLEAAHHYAALGQFIVNRVDILFAFLDPSRTLHGAGGTAAVVAEATSREIPCWVLRPEGTAVVRELRPIAGEDTLRCALARALGRLTL